MAEAAPHREREKTKEQQL